jgi:hypothetical protein
VAYVPFECVVGLVNGGVARGPQEEDGGPHKPERVDGAVGFLQVADACLPLIDTTQLFDDAVVKWLRRRCTPTKTLQYRAHNKLKRVPPSR